MLMKQSKTVQESCVDSFSYGFFLDLVHPESTETDLLNAIKGLLRSEIMEIKKYENISNLLHDNYVLRGMIRNYLKKKNQRKYMKLIFKKGLQLSLIHI